MVPPKHQAKYPNPGEDHDREIRLEKNDDL